MTNTAPRPTRSPAGAREAGVPGTPLEWAVGTAAFAVEVALAVTVAVAAYRSVDGGALGWLAAVVALAALVAVWGRWMSPKAPRRLPRPGRLVLGPVLTVIAAAAILAVGSPAWGLTLGVAGVAVTLVAQSMQDR
ncbi:DUF2568 domain-containing protein [Nakamurella lactea]|uniref:DUF2568 domain-containing protein n=1 Tax=Nakamurella lactea TaxID=459515 RepID=UPI0003F7CC05|nr:DUF2568 domain-containing protein [Nakamurella lactea]